MQALLEAYAGSASVPSAVGPQVGDFASLLPLFAVVLQAVTRHEPSAAGRSPRSRKCLFWRWSGLKCGHWGKPNHPGLALQMRCTNPPSLLWSICACTIVAWATVIRMLHAPPLSLTRLVRDTFSHARDVLWFV
eukprot:EG_transcript_37602